MRRNVTHLANWGYYPSPNSESQIVISRRGTCPRPIQESGNPHAPPRAVALVEPGLVVTAVAGRSTTSCSAIPASRVTARVYLGTVLDTGITWKINGHLNIYFYGGRMFAGSVVGANYPAGRDETFGNAESTLAF